MEDFVCDRCSCEPSKLYCFAIYNHGLAVEWVCKACKLEVEEDFFRLEKEDKKRTINE